MKIDKKFIDNLNRMLRYNTKMIALIEKLFIELIDTYRVRR